MTDHLKLEVKDNIATMTLNRPEVRNALSTEMVDAFVENLEDIRTNPDIQAVVLTGAGDAFCAGGDIKAMKAASEKKEPMVAKYSLYDGVQRIPRALVDFDKPIIAAVNGAATGAGLDIACHCDFRLCSDDARFAESYSNMGLVPGAGGCWVLPRVVGLPMALELAFTANLIDADEALRIGLVNHVYPKADLMEETYKLVRKISRKAPISIRLIKRAIYQGMDMDIRAHLDQISSHMTLARASEDHAEAVNAFLEKRFPVFKGK
ncbi:MAG: enoyl-CoA hydratase-related protein [Proteobacteria bacterium]|nr:enoyl-CoA hydratase-related protein [Pseudomonadota bacterium]